MFFACCQRTNHEMGQVRDRVAAVVGLFISTQFDVVTSLLRVEHCSVSLCVFQSVKSFSSPSTGFVPVRTSRRNCCETVDNLFAPCEFFNLPTTVSRRITSPSKSTACSRPHVRQKRSCWSVVSFVERFQTPPACCLNGHVDYRQSTAFWHPSRRRRPPHPSSRILRSAAVADPRHDDVTPHSFCTDIDAARLHCTSPPVSQCCRLITYDDAPTNLITIFLATSSDVCDSSLAYS